MNSKIFLIVALFTTVLIFAKDFHPRNIMALTTTSSNGMCRVYWNNVIADVSFQPII